MKTKKLNKAQLTGLIKEELAKLKKRRNLKEGAWDSTIHDVLTFTYGEFEEADRGGGVGGQENWIGGTISFNCKEIPGLSLLFGADGYYTRDGEELESMDQYPAAIELQGNRIEINYRS